MINEPNQQYDLEDRTARLGERIIELCKKASSNVVSSPILSQLVRAGTSVGANYCEANGASSKKDFRNKIYICKKESNETKYWLRMLAKAEPNISDDCRLLFQEAQELTLIFSAIARNTIVKR